MKKVFGIILIIAAIFVVSYVFKTIPTNTLTGSKPSETPAAPSNTQTTSGQYSAPSGGTATYTPPAPEATPLNQRVYISSAYVSGYPSQYSRIALYTRLKEGETVDITGWKIKSNKSEIIIPQAIELYDPSGNGANGNIVLKPNNYVDIYDLNSPLNRNLRLNKCVGYLAQIYNFGPISVSYGCPYISSSETKNLSGQCQSYVQSLGSCQTPDQTFYNSLPGSDEGNACRAFLQNIGYGSCFRSHQQEKDFLSNTWIVWLEQQNLDLDSQHDYVRLYDTNGSLISEYSY
ncbi:MAG: hypothetical protein WC475_02235 [Candidatus Paceibacterota bacterium]